MGLPAKKAGCYYRLPQRRDTNHRDVGEYAARRAVRDDLLADEVGQCRLILTDILDDLLVDPRPDTSIHQRLDSTPRSTILRLVD